jgi:endonuclease/exonuclease/phosphatase family metal-dependent hydrolase
MNNFLNYTHYLLFDKYLYTGTGDDSVKILTWNILAQTLSNSSYKEPWETRRNRIVDYMYQISNPEFNIVVLNEVDEYFYDNNNTKSEIQYWENRFNKEYFVYLFLKQKPVNTFPFKHGSLVLLKRSMFKDCTTEIINLEDNQTSGLVKTKIGDKNFLICTIHLKSGNNPDVRIRQLNQIMGKIVKETDKTYEILVIGDFNEKDKKVIDNILIKYNLRDVCNEIKCKDNINYSPCKTTTISNNDIRNKEAKDTESSIDHIYNNNVHLTYKDCLTYTKEKALEFSKLNLSDHYPYLTTFQMNNS